MFTFQNIINQKPHILCDFCNTNSIAIYKCVYTDNIEPIYFCKVCYNNC